jgi:enoyl-CoA hydratase/carnithine racemase
VTEPLLVTVADGIHRWTLNRPERRNALDGELVDMLLAAAERAREQECRAVVLCGEPPVFCAGSDVAEFASQAPEAIVELESRWPVLRDAIRSIPAPVVAGIQGGAFGGGLVLALYADHRIAEERAVFSLPEVSLGWIPPGGIEELVGEVGVAHARRLVLTSARLRAPEALAIGLVQEVVPGEELERALDRTGSFLAARPAAAVGSVKAYLRERSRLSGEERDALQLAEFARNVRTPQAEASIRRLAAASGEEGLPVDD